MDEEGMGAVGVGVLSGLQLRCTYIGTELSIVFSPFHGMFPKPWARNTLEGGLKQHSRPHACSPGRVYKATDEIKHPIEGHRAVRRGASGY